jgi:3',5'-cyclic AMP phosphodiesterase CpdA
MNGRIFALATAILTAVAVTICLAQTESIPSVYSGISKTADDSLVFTDKDGNKYPEIEEQAKYTLERLRANPTGTETGIAFDFGIPDLQGKLYYGLIQSPPQMKYPQPIYCSHAENIDSGKVTVNIKRQLSGIRDIIGWQKTGIIHLGYRVANDNGQIIYDGKIMLHGKGPFRVDTCIVEGPFANRITPNGAVISFESNFPATAKVIVDGKEFTDRQAARHHEIEIAGLQSDTTYDYEVNCGADSESYSLTTAPLPGSRKPFTFAYASDCRANQGGGERNIWGVNGYILKRIGALCADHDVRFLQFSGDLVSGYTTDQGEIELEYANWKRIVEPFAHYLPFVAGIGNHESNLYYFSDGKRGIGIDRFPFATQSAEAIFATNFVNPINGPASEDGAAYDPDPDKTDFPPYSENVFYYTYDNVAIVVLNSNYWYAYNIEDFPETGGNLHGYIMDEQMKWLEKTLATLEADDSIDHIFVTMHCPIFPNGGHVGDDMWYYGNNVPRPTITGKPVDKGIIECRDRLLDLLMNHSTKVKATLTGDEHNYSLLHVSADMPIYPDNWTGQRLTKFRPFWHINNGAAGAPYYGRQATPWQDHLQSFSAQNALVLIHVNGKQVSAEVINPDTLERLDEFEL